MLNDASRLDPTPVSKHLRPAAGQANLVDLLRREIREAQREGRPVCIGGARHSMGGQSLRVGSTAITLDRGWCEPDAARGLYRASAGARWREIIPVLDRAGFAPAVTQANSDFTLGGAFSVNVHGWAVPHPPMGSTVKSVTLLLPDGQLVTCSPTQDAELFSLAMGGYGLFGVLLEMDVAMAPNASLAPRFSTMPAASFAKQFVAAVHEPAVVMAYGRLSIARHGFLDQAAMVSFQKLAAPARPLAQSRDSLAGLTRGIYRAQEGSDLAKGFRWFAETRVQPMLDSRETTRNALISTPVSALAEPRPDRTDILHEYFLPPRALADFIADCREIIPRASAELLNITLRYIAADRTSVMAFAPTDRIAAVMSFSQALTPEADARMRPVTQELIDRALAHGGSFYLPYRLHARSDQLERAYPNLQRFIAAKRRLDPKGTFLNTMWDTYFARWA
ncbi:MAG: FAD-binding protein [Phenylobacterium sp.]